MTPQEAKIHRHFQKLDDEKAEFERQRLQFKQDRADLEKEKRKVCAILLEHKTWSSNVFMGLHGIFSNINNFIFFVLLGFE